MNEEIIKVDISKCIAYIRFVSALPLEIVLIQKFKMSFQNGESSVDYFNRAISRNLLKVDESPLSVILLKINVNRYYKAIYGINTILEQAILGKLDNPDIDGVEYKSIENIDGKLIATFKINR